MRVRVLRELKHDGARHSPGSVLDVELWVANRWMRNGSAEYVEEPVSEAVVAEREDVPIPEEFPGRDALIEAGYTDLFTIPLDSEALQEIHGIGQATAEAILAEVEKTSIPDESDGAEQ